MSTLKKKHGLLRVLITIVAVILLLAIIIVLGARIYFRAPIREYYNNSEKSFVIPELNSGMIMQGLDYNEADGTFVISGYRANASSLLAVVEKQSGQHTKTVEMKNADGSDYTGHVGGVAINGNHIYVANGGKSSIDIFSYSDLSAANTGDSIKLKASVSLKTDGDAVNPAFITFYDNCLVVGEFYRAPNYNTTESHHLSVTGGTNHALAVCFALDDASEYGFDIVPAKAYSIPDMAQGMAFDDERAYISTSYGPSFSHIYAYNIKSAKSLGTINILGKQTEVFAFDTDSLAKDMKIAPMSEEIEIVDGKMYTMCEAATNKYIFGKFTSAKYCYATDLSKYFG